MKLLTISFLATAFLLFGCISVNWENQTVSLNISMPENVSLPGEANATPSTGLSGENATVTISPSAPSPSVTMLPGSVKVCVFGERRDAVGQIFSQGTAYGGKTVGTEVKWLDNNAKPMDLDDCAIALLTDGGEGRYLDPVPREAVREKVLGGMGLIVSQEAGTLVHGDEAVKGWGLLLGGIVPVSPVGEQPNLTGVNGSFVKVSADPALAELEQFNVSGINVTEVYPSGDATPVALFRTGQYQTSVSYYAAVRRQAGSGMVYYLSFPPDAAPQVFKAVSDYLIKGSLQAVVQAG
ncbi:MAG: hypothetical protein NTY90_00865 [Candidatus Micrarchaeota archaeon]|nr:hypothetical protein [Candidatus Micrarchaeota archaeon]